MDFSVDFVLRLNMDSYSVWLIYVVVFLNGIFTFSSVWPGLWGLSLDYPY